MLSDDKKRRKKKIEYPLSLPLAVVDNGDDVDGDDHNQENDEVRWQILMKSKTELSLAGISLDEGMHSGATTPKTKSKAKD